MNSEVLLNNIKREFKDITLDNAYTLPEEDYADTSYWYFDKVRTDLNLTEEEWIKQETNFINTSGWYPEDRQAALNAINGKSKMFNRYSNPLDIPFRYLDIYSTGFSFLKPKAYLFYTPSTMIYVLNDSYGINSASFLSWLNRLSCANNYELVSELLKYFTKQQISILVSFLLYISDSTNRDLYKNLIFKCLQYLKLDNLT